MKNKKKIIIICIVVILVLAAIIAGIVYFVRSRGGSVVDVYSMELLNSSGFAGGESSLSGTINSDYVQEVYADEDQDVADVYVQQGDYVKKGDKLLKYDVEEQELDLQLQKLEIQSSTMELEDLEDELNKMKKARASGTIDGSGSDVMNASLNLSSLRGDILARLMSTSDQNDKTTEESDSNTLGTTESKTTESGDTEETSSADTAGETTRTTESSGTTAGSSTETGTTESTTEGSASTGTESSSADSQKDTSASSSTKNQTQSAAPEAKTSSEEKEETEGSKLLDTVNSLDDASSGNGSEESPYVFNLNSSAEIKGSVLRQLVGEESKNVYAYFFQYASDEEYEKDSDKSPSERENYTDGGKIEINPNKFASEWSDESYSFSSAQAAVRDRKLKGSITAINDRETGEGTDGAPYVFLLKGNGADKMISGSVIYSLLRGNYTAVFKVYDSETAYANSSDNTVASFVLNPVYDTDGIDQNVMYSIEDLREVISDKKLKSKIEMINDNSFGDGSANDSYIYLLSSGGTVRGSVILALVGGDYYAEFQEYESEEAYKNSPYSPTRSVSITPGIPVAGIESAREYTLDDLQKALDAAEAASRLPNVLKSEITDKKNDAYRGSGTMNDPYVYRMISDGRIRGSVINDLMKNNEFAVFYEYDSEEDGRRENVANSIEIRPNTIFKESIASFGWYTLADLNDAMVAAEQIQIQPNRTSVTAGKSYNFTAKLSGKNSDVLKVTWELKRNKSDATTLINGTLTVGEDETANTLRIIASAGGKRAVLTVKVKKSSSSSSENGIGGSGGSSGSDSDGYDSDYDSDYDGGSSGGSDTDYNSYTADELADAISDKEAEIAEARQKLNEAKLDYEEAKKEVDAATVKATVSGEVTLAYTKEAMPDDGSPAVIVRGEDGMYVDVDVSEMSLDTVKVGGTIYCTSMETYEQYEAEIIDISPYPASGSNSDSGNDGMSNPNSSYYPVVAYIANADGLVTGETVEVSYSSQSMGTVSDEAIYLQKAYVRTDDDDRSYVYKEGKNGRLEKQYVKTGETLYGQYVEILSGLTMDDKIAFPYGKDVKEGAKVELSENTDNIIY